MSDTKKFIRTQERLFSAHHLLMSAAKSAAESAKSVYPLSDENNLIVAFTMSALAVEAFFNTVGHLIFPDWSEFESAPTRVKIFLVGRELNISIDKSRSPWQQILELGKFRNDIVHAKPERIINTDRIDASERERRRFEIPRSKFESRLTLPAAERAIMECNSAFGLVMEKLPEQIRIDVITDGWSTTHVPE